MPQHPDSILCIPRVRDNYGEVFDQWLEKSNSDKEVPKQDQTMFLAQLPLAY
jgi:hypothetical protein